VIKEGNPPELNGTATGLINSLCFTFRALLGPVFGRIIQSGSSGNPGRQHYQAAIQPMSYGVALAIGLTFLLQETGSTVRAKHEVQETL
jgi:hypothetical protein